MSRISILFIVSIFMVFSPLFASDDQDKSLSGTVSDVDWTNSKLTFHYFDLYSGNPDEINLIVTSDSELNRGGDSISLSDIEQGDPATVTYYNDGFSGLKIRRFADLNRAPG